MLILAVALLSALTYALRAPALHIDGAFQTASFLYRVKAGEIPGKDFFPYLGLGIGWALYLPFRLMGEHLSDSEFLTVFYTISSVGFSALIISALVPEGKQQRRSLVMIIVVAIIMTYSLVYFAGRLTSSSLFNPVLDERVFPGASLRSLRSFIIYIGIAIIGLINTGLIPSAYRLVCTALISGLAATWTLDSSVPVLLAGPLCYAFSPSSKQSHISELDFNHSHEAKKIHTFIHHMVSKCTKYLAAVGLSATVAATFISLMTKGNLLGYINYVRSIGKDQQWFFNVPAYGSSYVFRMRSIFDIFGSPPPLYLLLTLLILAVVWVQAIRLRSAAFLTLACIGLGLLMSGMLTSYSSATPSYYGAFMAWGFVVALSYSVDLSLRIAAALLPSMHSKTASTRLSIILAIPLLIASHTYASERKHLHRDEINGETEWLPELNAYAPRWMVRDFMHVQALVPEHSTVISDYWNWLSLGLATKNVLRVDSLIHALGDERRLSIDALARKPPQYAFSTSLAFSKDWSRWNMAYSWWFFRYLRQHYNIIYLGNSINVWKRKDGSSTLHKEQTKTECTLSHTQNEIYVRSSRPVALASLRFSIQGIPLNPRHFFVLADHFNDGAGAGSFDGHTALNPFQKNHQQPILTHAGVNRYSLYQLDGTKRILMSSSRITEASCEYMDFPELPTYRGEELSFKQPPPWTRSPLPLQLGLEYLSTGWQNPREEGVYSGGNSLLTINLDSDFIKSINAGKDWTRLHVKYSPWHTLAASSQATTRYQRRKIHVTVNGQFIGILPANKPQEYSISIGIPPTLLRPGLNNIGFFDPLASSPYSDFAIVNGARSSDRRAHSFFLSSLAINK